MKEVRQKIILMAICLLAPLIASMTRAASVSPQFVEKTEDVRVTEGSSATFYCGVKGNPKPRIKWLKNGSTVSSVGSRIAITKYDGMSILRIDPVQKIDDATYECVAKSVGDPVTADANLTVFQRQ